MKPQNDTNTRISLEAHQAMSIVCAHLRIDHKTLLDMAVGAFLEQQDSLLPFLTDELKTALLGSDEAESKQQRE
jgi:hypothetical protein